jgi:hypothetical protein
MKYFRPLTKSMIQKLQDCRAKELNGNGEACRLDEMNYAVAPLYKRGLIETKKLIVNNKDLMVVFVTEAGIEFLKKLND